MRVKILGIEKERNEVNKLCFKLIVRVVDNDIFCVWDMFFWVCVGGLEFFI